MQATRLTQVILLLSSGLSQWWQRPWYTHFFRTISLLGGFFTASVIVPVIGALALWHVPIALVFLLVIETINYLVYRKIPIFGLESVHLFKLGILFGFTLDSFKLAS